MNNKDILYIFLYTVISSIYCILLVHYRYKNVELYSFRMIFLVNLITVCILTIFCFVIINIRNVLQYLFLFFYIFALYFLVTSKNAIESFIILICCAHVTYMIFHIQEKQGREEVINSQSLFGLELSDEQKDLEHSFISIFRHLNILCPILIVFGSLYHIQVYIFVNTQFKCSFEKYGMTTISILFLNLYMWIFARMFIKSNVKLSLYSKLKNIAISMLSGVYIFENTKNNISEILILIGYVYMISINRLYLKMVHGDIIKYSLMFYSNTSIFSWIMACVSFYSVEMNNYLNIEF